jgi:hypothetical protein
MSALICCTSSSVAVSEYRASKAPGASGKKQAAREEYEHRPKVAGAARANWLHDTASGVGPGARQKEERRKEREQEQIAHPDNKKEKHGSMRMRQRSISYDSVLEDFFRERPEIATVQPNLTTDRVSHPEPTEFSDTYLKVMNPAGIPLRPPLGTTPALTGAQDGSKDFSPRRKHRRQPMAPTGPHRGRYQPPSVTTDEEPRSVTVFPPLESRPIFLCS